MFQFYSGGGGGGGGGPNRIYTKTNEIVYLVKYVFI